MELIQLQLIQCLIILLVLLLRPLFLSRLHFPMPYPLMHLEVLSPIPLRSRLLLINQLPGWMLPTSI